MGAATIYFFYYITEGFCPFLPSSVQLYYFIKGLGIDAEMKVKVITRGRSGEVLADGGSATLICNREEYPVTNNGDGT